MVPGTTPRPGQRTAAGTYFVYADPIYVPELDLSASTASVAAQSPAPPVPGVAIYVSQPAPPPETVHSSLQVLGNPPAQPAVEPPPTPDRYLFAFKDHSIFAAVAYWVDGDTLHYFPSGDTHKQAPLSALDRPFTEKLNRETGVALKLPPERK